MSFEALKLLNKMGIYMRCALIQCEEVMAAYKTGLLTKAFERSGIKEVTRPSIGFFI